MGSRGSGFENDSITGMINNLVFPQQNSTGNELAAEHILAYIEAISRKDHDLVEMMDRHAQFMFGDSTVDENGNAKPQSQYWKDLWDKTNGQKVGYSGGQVTKDFRELRKELLNNTSAKDLQKLKKLVTQMLPGTVKDVTVQNGEISINYADGSREVFDNDLSIWPF